jgi:large subunit ribosomal protein L2
MKNIKVIKYLSFGLKNKTGINFSGHRTVLSKGSGRSKRKFRLIDFSRSINIPGIILRIEYDPNRSCNIALVCYKNGFLSYIIAVSGMKENMFINTGFLMSGSVKILNNFDLGSFVCCIELRKNFGAKIARSAGCFSVILSRAYNKVCIRLPSGEERFLKGDNSAILGVVSNIQKKFKKKKKASDNIFLGKKPSVRGVAKNCVDHPHGGGRGKTSPLALSSNFTRRVLKGVPTVKNKKLFKRKNWVFKERRK